MPEQLGASDFTQKAPSAGPLPASSFTAPSPKAVVSQPVVQPAQQPPASAFEAPSPAQTNPVRMPGGLRSDVQATVDNEARTQGIPVWALRAIARTESGGQPDPIHSTSPAGAQGVMQIMPDTWRSEGYKGSPNNLQDNVRAGATYYKMLLTKYGDPIKAAGAYNVGPGAFDDYLAGKRTLPQETINYMASVAAMHVPIDETPLPPHVLAASDFGTKLNLNPGVSATYQAPATIGKRLPGQQGSNVNPAAAKYQWYDQIFGHQDLPFIMDNVHTLDQISPGQNHLAKALALYVKNPAAAADAYGDNAKRVLEELAEMPAQKDPILEARRQNARAMLAHPMLALGETFLTEFFNPMSWAEGAITGKVMGLGGVALRATRAGRAASAAASPYREIVGAHGFKARNDINAMGAVMSRAEAPSKELTAKIFGGLTHGEQWEVMRRSVKGAAPNAAHNAQSAILNPRAALLRQHIKDLTAAKVKAGLLIKSANPVTNQVKDVETYLPLRGLFTHPIYNEETIASMKRMGGGGPGSATKGESLHEGVYATLDDAVASGKLDMSKHSAAEVFYNFSKNGGENIAYENGLKRLAAEHPDMIRPGAMQGNHMLHAGAVPLMKDGRQMWAATDKISNIKSPFLQKAWVSPEFTDLINKRAAAHEGPAWAANEHIQKVLTMVTKLNGAQRNMITTNPGYHPFWNIASNASSADRQGLVGTMKNYVQALVGTAFTVAEFARAIPGGAGVAAGHGLDAMSARFWAGSHHYAADLAAAIEAGAVQHMAPSTSALGGNLSRIRTVANSELHPLEKVDKILTQIEDWNTRGAFGKFGEERFVVDMYKRRIARGLEPSDAAWEVREALGNVQDVGKNPASKMMMFYPWLAKNVMHWMIQFMTNPKLARAQVESFHRHNELAGDPNALNAQYRKNPSQLYLGKDEKGEDKNWTGPFPWKDAEKVGEALLPGPDDLGERSKVLLSMVAGRAKIVPQDLINLGMTAYLDPAQREVYNGFTVMYDRNQPLAEELRQGALSVAENAGIYPAPFMVHDIMAHGFDSSHMVDYITNAAGAGTITRSQSRAMKRPVTRADWVYRTSLGKLEKRMQGPNPLEPEEYQARKKVINDRHAGVLQRQKDALTKKASPSPAQLRASDFH